MSGDGHDLEPVAGGGPLGPTGREPARHGSVVSSAALAEIGAEDALEEPDEAAEAGDLATEARSQWSLFLRRFLRHKLAVLSLLLLIGFGLLAVFAPAVAPYELTPELTAEVLAEARQGPSAKHWFGTDELGRDQLTRILFAARVSLGVGLSVAVVSAVIGTLVGSLAGYFGSWVDQLFMRVTDLVLVVPALAVLLVASREFGESVVATIFILSGLFWMQLARVVRGVFLSLKEKEYVEAARASGASSWRVIFRHILPNAVGPIVVNTSLVVGLAILTEATLSFLGFGVQPPTVTWGNMLNQSVGTVGTPRVYLVYFPGLALLLTVLAVNFLGDGLRDALDPQADRR